MKYGICDIHSHILPALDDGAKNWDETMEMLRTAYDSGVRAIIATPHYLPWKERRSAERIASLCQEAMERAKRDLGIDILIYAGNELYYHQELPEALESGDALTLAGSKYILVEFSEGVAFKEMKHALESLQRSGYRVILAHCERYICIREERSLEEILEMGVLLQSNAEEIERGMFDQTKRWLTKRYKAQQISFIGSDMHHITRRKPLSPSQVSWYERKLPEDYRRRLFYENAESRLGIEVH